MQTRSQRKAAASAQPLPTRPLVFPTEIVCLILASLSSLAELESEMDGSDSRNANLARAALVGRQWQASAYTLLYGKMRICWSSSRGLPLLRSFAANPALHALVRSVDVYRLNEQQYLADWLNSDIGLREMEHVRTEAIRAGVHLDVLSAPFMRVAALGVQQVRRAVEAQGDHVWLIGAESVRDGSRLFWTWIGNHSNLDDLLIKDFEEPLPILPDLGPILSRLSHVTVVGTLPPGFLPHLAAVESLLLAGAPPTDSSPSPAETDTSATLELPLPRLVVFGACGWSAAALSIFSRSPVALCEVQLSHADTTMMNALATLLPSLPNLVVLKLHLLPPHTASPPLLAALPTSPIQHLTTNIWPPLELSYHFPSNLRSIDIVSHLDSEQPLEELVGPFEDALRWKDRRAPHLDAVGIEFPYLGARRGCMELRKRLRAKGRLVKGFDLLITEATKPAEGDEVQDDP